MRAAVVLALILGLAGPPVAWSSAPADSTQAGAAALAAPAAAPCALVRNAVTAEKVVGRDWLAAVESSPPFPCSDRVRAGAARRVSPAHLDFDHPPQAPRPPPARRSQQSTVDS